METRLFPVETKTIAGLNQTSGGLFVFKVAGKTPSGGYLLTAGSLQLEVSPSTLLEIGAKVRGKLDWIDGKLNLSLFLNQPKFPKTKPVSPNPAFPNNPNFSLSQPNQIKRILFLMLDMFDEDSVGSEKLKQESAASSKLVSNSNEAVAYALLKRAQIPVDEQQIRALATLLEKPEFDRQSLSLLNTLNQQYQNGNGSIYIPIKYKEMQALLVVNQTEGVTQSLALNIAVHESPLLFYLLPKQKEIALFNNRSHGESLVKKLGEKLKQNGYVLKDRTLESVVFTPVGILNLGSDEIDRWA